MRSAEFDREQVLRAAMNAFMEKGYNKTSMQDLKRATNLHPGSIYCAFENKKGLLLAALEQYNQDRTAELKDIFAAQSSAIGGLKAYLDSIVSECVSGDPTQTCLSQKAINEIAQQDEEAQGVLSNQCKLWQSFMCDVFTQIGREGSLEGERSAEQRAQSLIVGIYGLRTYSQAQKEPKVISDIAHQLLIDVCR
ncbi:TetR/AcrR family transcriptional regulator [Pseudoalteromonas luteoviolacea]|uniref:TetR/AcrR family transcriptional regulator n=1 Tax=Pseudoalteromonas luteoviolacea TaxID=43657 RepID=UPI001B396F1C|nr:TetR/AcrR family transcriptional regulator [Pseudoalteromonas luteoviolacea]MBQ4813001.1 TetR/AcrR family transcriptional regulator [Pseudoalteromonas luteoviolacea]